MVKVKITRDCSIEGKHYGVGDVAEVIEKDRDLLLAIEKAVAYDGKPEPKMVKKGRKQMDLVADIRTMLNDIAVYSTLAMILFRRDQEKQQELTEIERGKGSDDWKMSDCGGAEDSYYAKEVLTKKG